MNNIMIFHTQDIFEDLTLFKGLQHPLGLIFEDFVHFLKK